jgi:copper chaperone CopZ
MKGEILMKTILRSKELSCPSCVAKIEKALKAVDGVQDAKVHFNTGRIEVEHEHPQVDPDKLVQVVESVGYQSKVSTF